MLSQALFMLSTCLIEEFICWPCHLHVPCALTSLVPLWQQRRIENTIYTATETSQKKRWWNCSGQSEIKCHQRITPCVTARSKGGPLVLNSFGWKNTRSAQAEPIVLQLFAPPPFLCHVSEQRICSCGLIDLTEACAGLFLPAPQNQRKPAVYTEFPWRPCQPLLHSACGASGPRKLPALTSQCMLGLRPP